MGMRGLSDDAGSWNTMPVRRRIAKRSFCDAFEMSCPTAVSLPSAIGKQADRGAAERGLARAGLAHEADDLAGVDLQVDVLRGAERGDAAALRVVDRDVLERQHRGAGLDDLLGRLRGALADRGDRRERPGRRSRRRRRSTSTSSSTPRPRCGHRRREAAACTGAAGSWKICVDGSGLDDDAVLHHHDAVGEVGHHAHVVRDEDDRRVEALVEVAHQIEDLGLNRHVQRRRRLVGDQQQRVARDRLRDHRALPLATRQLVRRTC